MKVKKIALVGLAPAAVALAIGLSACGGSSASAATSGSSSSTASAQSASTQTYTLEVLNGKLAGTNGITAPDGKGHDTFVPSHMTVKAGVPVTMTVYNYDEGPHTFTISSLGVNETIPAHVSDTQPSVVTFTVTFPKAGTYRFFCAMPCDAGHGGWAMTTDRLGKGMDQSGFMAGYVSAM
jgi:uncharacterized cupredoxin-like copper-binding protein